MTPTACGHIGFRPLALVDMLQQSLPPLPCSLEAAAGCQTNACRPRADSNKPPDGTLGAVLMPTPGPWALWLAHGSWFHKAAPHPADNSCPPLLHPHMMQWVLVILTLLGKSLLLVTESFHSAPGLPF